MNKHIKISTKPIFYPASYLVMTVTSLLFLGAVAGLGAMVIDYWLNGISNILNDTVILYLIASLLVVTPMHLLAYRQVRSIDKSQVTTFSLRFANGLLGAYLFVLVGSTILLSTWLLAILLNAWLGTGDFGSAHLLASILALIQAIVWLKYATRHFVQVRSGQPRPQYYMLVVGILSTIVLAASLVFPVLAYRSVARDFVKENDLTQVSLAIGDYVDTHNNLPVALSDLEGLRDNTVHRLANYHYAPRGDTGFGIFGYSLCTTFARSNGKGHDAGFGFASHGAGNQCFARTTISFTRFSQDLSKSLNNDTAKLRIAIQNFLLGAEHTVNQEIAGVETFAGGQLKSLERDLEGLEGGTTELQQEMQRLGGSLTGLEGNTGELAQDFAAVEKFLYDLGCLFGGCKNP